MSNWKAKSDESIAASNKLMEVALTNTSVHCSYYSCVQYVFHVMTDYFGMGTAEVETQSRGSINQIGTHHWLRKEIYQSLRQRNKNHAKTFNNDMSELFNRRVAADYYHEIIQPDEAAALLQKATDTIDILQQNYEV